MKMLKMAAAGALALLVWGCVLSPGKFEAALDLRKDGRFTYRYTGEIQLHTGQSMAAAAEAENDRFDPEAHPCWKEGTPPDQSETRECTPQEIADARKQWEEDRKARGAARNSDNAMMKAMMGGLDPSDPKTMDEFARRLQTYHGWKRVVHRGEGVFDVQYEVSGRLDHDFLFPVFPEVDYIVPFVQVTLRTDGRVRIVAPALVQQGQNGFGGGMAAAMAGGGTPKGPAFKKPEGTFTVTTDAEIVTNNTNDGPSASPAGKVLRWVVGPLDGKKPEALLRL